MKMYLKATTLQRFIAYIIDVWIVAGISYGLTYLVLFLIKFDYQNFNNLYNYIYDNYYNYLLGQTASIDVNVFTQNAIEFLKLFAVREGILLGFELVFMIGYLVILPIFWKRQTVGRVVTKTKVISHKPNTELTVWQIIRREILGTFLCYSVLSYFLGFISLLLVLLLGRSLADLIGGTDLVLETPLEVNNETEEGFYNYFNKVNNGENPYSYKGNDDRDDVIDAEVKDLDNNKNDYDDYYDNLGKKPKDDSNDSSTNDSNDDFKPSKKERRKFDDDNDEYEVF